MQYVFAYTRKQFCFIWCTGLYVHKMSIVQLLQGHKHMHPIKINCGHMTSIGKCSDGDWVFSRDFNVEDTLDH